MGATRNRWPGSRSRQSAGPRVSKLNRQQRPGLDALLDYARQGDAIVVVGVDRLGRNAAEVMTIVRDLGERGIVLRSLREGIDTSNSSGRMVAGVLASLAELEPELGRERFTGNPSVAQRLSTTPRRRWRSGCTPPTRIRLRLVTGCREIGR
jgi:DNA invertase Pin-like site-specific DNA recombinase